MYFMLFVKKTIHVLKLKKKDLVSFEISLVDVSRS